MGQLLLAAVTPVAFILYLVYKKDTEKEPVSVLLKCFGMGILIVVPIIVMELALSAVFEALFPPGKAFNFLNAFVVAAFSEELFKFLALLYVLRKTHYFDQHYDGIVYAVFVSMGFAMVENVGYVMEGGLGVAALRAVLSLPAHAFFGVFMGYFISLAYLGRPEHRNVNMRLALLVPIIIHGLYDYLIFEKASSADSGEFAYLSLLLLLFLVLNISFWRYGLRRIREHVKYDEKLISKREKQPEDEPFS